MRTICCRDSDEDFQLAKSDRSPIAREVCLGSAWRGSSSEDYPLEKSSFMRNLAEGRPMVDFGWRWGGSPAGGVWGIQGRSAIVEIQPLEPVRCESSSEIHPLWKLGRSPILVGGRKEAAYYWSSVKDQLS